MDRAARAAAVAACAAVAVALYLATAATPPARGLGESVRILYVHVGAAWTAYVAYGVTAVAAVAYLRRRRPIWDRWALASAEWGLVLTTLTLGTGMLWGRAVGGWWWRWDDSRLTLTLMLWLLYAAYLILRQYTAGERRATLSAVLALAGVPTMLLNHFAVILFPAYHPPPIAARPEGPAMAEAYVLALVASVLAYTLLYVWLLVARVALEERRDHLALAASRAA